MYTERSYQPFIRDVFHQFSETRTGGAFTFMTGIGGFLQEFLYGYSGMRWNSANVGLDPTLNSQIGGIVLHAVQWRGRTFQVTIGQQRTTVTLQSGAPLPIPTPGGLRTVSTRPSADAGHPPARSHRLERPGPLRARRGHQLSPGRAGAGRGRRQPGHRLAAGDGARVTDRAAPAAGRPDRHDHAAVGSSVAGRARSEHSAAPGPVVVLRPASYSVQVSEQRTHVADGGADRRSRRQSLDTVHLKHAVKARFVRIRVTAASSTKLPMLEELARPPGSPLCRFLGIDRLGVVADEEAVGARLVAVAADLDVASEQ